MHLCWYRSRHLQLDLIGIFKIYNYFVRLLFVCFSHVFFSRFVLKQKNSLLNCFPAYGTTVDLISAHLTRSMATQEYHILDAIEAHRAHCLEGSRKMTMKSLVSYLRRRRRNSVDTESWRYLFFDILQLLLELLHVIQLNVVDVGVRCMRCDCIWCCRNGIVHRHTDSQFVDAERYVIFSFVIE